MKRITTLTGPSCAGKSTLENMLAERGALKAVSTTTRLSRPGEVHGRDYYFVSHDTYDRMVFNGEFIETVRFGEHNYGMTVNEINRLFLKGDHVVIVCEPIGMGQIRAWCETQANIDLRRVFVDNPQQVINERFLKRASEDIFKAAVSGVHNAHVKVIETYAKRLEIMMKTEHAWRLDAHTYDVELLSFNDLNAGTIADQLMNPVALTM